MHFKFEYTAPGTPQQNGKIERKFATLYGMNRAMLNAAKFN
jgi:transposase InsO family protein